ncbi:hypothetical protein BJ742DRAFT_895245 [Cladochytrium replicatum]|nr:hypothetical protein BJ742DRAFT_895245 [Cladochytrium replicatum]
MLACEALKSGTALLLLAYAELPANPYTVTSTTDFDRSNRSFLQFPIDTGGTPFEYLSEDKRYTAIATSSVTTKKRFARGEHAAVRAVYVVQNDPGDVKVAWMLKKQPGRNSQRIRAGVGDAVG